jgi:hypothetical protein
MKNAWILTLSAWLLCMGLLGAAYLQGHWETALVLFAALLLVPEGLRLLRVGVGMGYWAAAVGLGMAYWAHAREWPYAALPALPYLLCAGWATVSQAARLLALPKAQLIDLVRVAALAYWFTGAVWATCFLAGIRPLGFDAVIVSLTAAHFHVAGFVLAVLAHGLMQRVPSGQGRLLGIGTLAGMPLVAAGITFSKLGWPGHWEWVFSWAFVAYVFLLIATQYRVAWQPGQPRAARLLWLASLVCLALGAALAALYAMRFARPIAWVNIPNMKIWHGTLNTLGFAWLNLLGWRRVG